MSRLHHPALLLLVAGAATADDLHRVHNAAYAQECGSCHVPYPPALLSAASWRAVMDGLPDHFGTDASVDADTSTTLRRFLEQNAGRRATQKNGAPQLRITETRWFLHEHLEELPPGIWTSPAVKSAANCGACHQRAADGLFDEKNIRLPAGATRK